MMAFCSVLLKTCIINNHVTLFYKCSITFYSLQHINILKMIIAYLKINNCFATRKLKFDYISMSLRESSRRLRTVMTAPFSAGSVLSD